MEQLEKLRTEVLAAFENYLKMQSNYQLSKEFSHVKFMHVSAARWEWQQAEHKYYELLHTLAEKK